MLNALIVDDERLVRKGLISTMPWDQYDIRIVGEAGHGRAALDFMEQQQVDLLFVDLTMPSMSGFELMKTVRVKYPMTKFVVLTCHQDFEYIQEAMRAGAIDYVVKTQLDKESMDDILLRIVQRINFERSNQAAGTIVSTPVEDTRPMLIIAGREPAAHGGIHEILQNTGLNSATAMGENIWSLPSTVHESAIRQFIERTSDFVLLKSESRKQLSVSDIRQYLFYELEQHRNVYDLQQPLTALEDKQASNARKTLNELWFSFHWLYDEKLWTELLLWIERTKPGIGYLSDVLRHSLPIWRELFPGGELDLYDGTPLSFGTWQGYQHTVGEMRNRIRYRMKQLDYFGEIIIAIMKALYLMRQLDDLNLNRDTVAAKINMSSGYFSECFKVITGKTFGEYMKILQIDKAKALLETTTYPIYHIAELSGYKDDKYFSKIFRERVGLGPAEYRKAHERSGFTP